MMFIVKFTRYDRETGERRISGRWNVTAHDFDQAAGRANDLLMGLRHGDPTRLYDVLSVEADRPNGTDCAEGGWLFETHVEFNERIMSK